MAAVDVEGAFRREHVKSNARRLRKGDSQGGVAAPVGVGAAAIAHAKPALIQDASLAMAYASPLTNPMKCITRITCGGATPMGPIAAAPDT